jgi:branched-chain amino acid transport system substrate-binding protein
MKQLQAHSSPRVAAATPLGCTLLLTLLIALSWSFRTHAEGHKDIEIGGLFDLTGGGAIWGKSESKAFQLACKDFEERNPGMRVHRTIEDTMFSSKNTVTALQKLSSIDKIHYVVGATWETTVSMMPICEAKHIICISPSYHGREYYERHWRYNFTAWFDDRGYSDALVSQMNERAYKKLAIFAAITPYYDSLVERFTSHAKAKIDTTERVLLEERDFKSMITKVPRDVDAILMLLDNAGQIQAFLKQWSELRRDRPDIYSDDLIIYLDPPERIEHYGFTYFYSYPLMDQTGVDHFRNHYEATYKEKPEGTSAAVAYDETMLLLECIKKEANISERVRDCVAATHKYEGFSGIFSFDGKQTVTNRAIGIKRYERF